MQPTSIKVSVQGQDVELVDVAKIDPNDLQRECCEQASKYIYWASMVAAVQKELEGATLELGTLKVELEKEHRKWLKDNGYSVTQKEVDKRVATDRRVMVLNLQVAEESRKVSILNAVKMAFSMRKDLLVSLANDARRERSPEVRVPT